MESAILDATAIRCWQVQAVTWPHRAQAMNGLAPISWPPPPCALDRLGIDSGSPKRDADRVGRVMVHGGTAQKAVLKAVSVFAEG